MKTLLVGQAKKIALEWVNQYAATHEIIGAFLNGSSTVLREEDILPTTSDIDINMIIDQIKVPPKIGKFVYRGVLLEVSFFPLELISPIRKALTTYEIANSFKQDNILVDKTGYLKQVVSLVSKHFSHPRWIGIRCQNALKKSQNGTKAFDPQLPVLDNVNRWLFPAGICTHVILTAAQTNPTVRLRYLAVRPILLKSNHHELYHQLLELLGCQEMDAQRVLYHLNHLTQTFDIAASCKNDKFPFSQDITPQARAVVIQGSQTLIEQQNHQEAVFWIAVSFQRCHEILRMDNPQKHQELMPLFLELLTDLGVETNLKIQKRIDKIWELYPVLEQTARQIIFDQK